jgi:hypothetical protein
MPERHCRSCLHSAPAPEGEWLCARYVTLISPEEQRSGCASHLYIPAFVRGEQIDAGDFWVLYTMPDGEEWRDGPQE